MSEQFAYIIIMAVLLFLVMRFMKKKPVNTPLPAHYPALLQQHVSYYRLLAPDQKKFFETKVNYFLQYTRIEGVGVTIDDLDKVLVASSAVIPIFAFPDWHYYNLTDVLLYKDTFNEDFQTEGEERAVLGMVGNGAMQNTMILSKPSLYEGFAIESSKSQTGIHEFVHLLDKSDGATDGLPENLMGKEYTLPWLQLMHRTIEEMKKGHSDINSYGATNEAEFLAVTSEYFFKRPDLLHEKHPELFALLKQIFHQNPSQPAPQKVS
jgi:Mlc titration factor MtfA (ptsG expression regulator)